MKLNMLIDSYNDAKEIRDSLASYQLHGWHFLYRGHASMGFELVSTIGRKKPINCDLQESEKLCFGSFKALIKSSKQKWLQYKLNSYNEDMFYMSIGRHIGLDCRLLDWTASLETALFFCASDKQYIDDTGCLFVLITKDINVSNASKNPFEIKDFSIIKEDYLIPDNSGFENFPLGMMRRLRQNGFFTISRINEKEVPLDELVRGETQILRFAITPNAKKDFLTKVGRNAEYLKLSDDDALINRVQDVNSQFFRQ